MTQETPGNSNPSLRIDMLPAEDLAGPDRAGRIQGWLDAQGIIGIAPQLFDEYPATFGAFELGFIGGNSPAVQGLFRNLLVRATEDSGLLELRARSEEMYALGIEARRRTSSQV